MEDIVKEFFNIFVFNVPTLKYILSLPAAYLIYCIAKNSLFGSLN